MSQYLDRKQVIELYKKYQPYMATRIFAYEKALRELPVVEDRPHGEWHTTPNPNYSPFDSTSEVIYMCSKCSYSSGERATESWNFCPNCGADMREGDAREECKKNPCADCGVREGDEK